MPNLKVKRWIYRHILKMKIGTNTTFAFKVVPDIIKPELITIGNNCVIGYNTTILTHEFLVDEYRTGPVQIGDNTLIGANVTILAGVTIGSNVKVGLWNGRCKGYSRLSLSYTAIQCKLNNETCN